MKTLFSILVLATIISCAPSLSYYTQNTHDSLVRDDSDPSKIQFYVSNDIINDKQWQNQNGQWP